MASIKTPSHYINAFRAATRGRPSQYPHAIYSVLISRFRHGLGPRFHSLFNLVDLPRERWNDYLDNEPLRDVLRLINQPAAREAVNNKLTFHDHCVAYSLPTIPVVCAILGNDDNNPKSLVIAETKEEWCERLASAPDRLFIKPIDGTWGWGAFVAEREEDQWHFTGNCGSAATFYAFLKQRMDSKLGWMVQPCVEAHQDLKPITSSRALPTIRANTCLVDGIPRLLFAALRLPVGDNVTDNFAHGKSGNIIAPIDMETGRLGKCRGSASTKWPDIVDVLVHPDTGNVIESYQVPLWEDVVTLLKQGQKSFPDLKTLGWDIAVTDDGPLIVEANATYDIDLIQVAYQKGVRSQLVDVFRLAPER